MISGFNTPPSIQQGMLLQLPQCLQDYVTHEQIAFMVGLHLYKSACEFYMQINKMGQIQVWAYLCKGFEYGHGRAESRISALLQAEIAHNHTDETLKRLNSYKVLNRILSESLL